MKEFTMSMLTKQQVKVENLKIFPGVKNIRCYASNSFTVKVALDEFYNNDFGLEKIGVNEPINEYVDQFIKFIKNLNYEILEYNITGIEYSLFYLMELGKTFDSYQYIFKALAGECFFDGVKGTHDWKKKIVEKVTFGNTQNINKASKKIEICELSKNILDSKGEDKYHEIKGKHPNLDQFLVFDVKLRIDKKLQLKSLSISEAKKMALSVLTKYLFSEDASNLYLKEINKSCEIVFQILKEEVDNKGFSHKEVINRLLRRDQLQCFLSYALAVEKIYNHKDSYKTIKSRCKKIFTDIEQDENLILIETLQVLTDMVKQIYRDNS